ncbi:hypothetical protein BaRGS_00026893 [Batillaria attramentaria]|uniref:HORMA domain-containing protein n=1 Tax=Batillaria attramentaria TaxID=370345 RepID=A0ABD0K384_9CAEN
MATSQMIRPEEKTGTWASMFPVEQVTEQQSALFAKKLLAVAISNITYLRAIFPEPAYGDRCLGDLNLKILKDDSAYPGASQVIKWVKGCFDALDKKYLRLLIIGIYVDPKDPNTVIESYTFKFSYSTQCGVDIYRNGKKITSTHSTEKTKKETIQLLRTIIVLTQSLQPLPDNVMMTMKLLYYDEVTPVDYEPPGFKPSTHDSFHFEEEPVNIKLGDVSTPFHSVKMRIKTDKQQFDYRDDEADELSVSGTICNDGLDKEQETESQKETPKDVYEFEDKSMEKDMEAQVKEGDVPVVSPGMPETSRDARTPSENVHQDDEFKVRCPCGCNEDDGLMIVCDVCNLWQHAAGENQKKATDPYLNELNSFAVQATCLWRRALAACTEFTRMLAPALAQRLGVDTTVAQGLINRLEKEGFIRAPNKGRRLGKVVDKEKVVKQGIPAYFKSSQKSDKRNTENMDTAEKPMDMDETDTGRTVRPPAPNKDTDAQSTPKMKQDSEKDGHKNEEKRRRRKRVYSKVDQTEFDLCGSQDTYDTRSRRKKCSDVQKSVAV